MSKGIKILLGLFIIVIVSIGSGLYIVSTKIKPEDIKKIAIDTISKSLPGAQVEIKKVDYSLGSSVKFKLDSLNIKLKENSKNLFNVKDVTVNIPVWAILTGGGTIDVRIIEPNAYYEEFQSGITNWSQAIPKETQKIEKTKTVENSNDEQKIEIPTFVENSKVNILIDNVHLKYIPYQKKQSNIVVSKINLKNLNLLKSTAFEIISNIEFAVDANKKFKTDIQIIGEVGIGKFLKEKLLETSIVMDIKNTSMTGLPLKIPNIENKLNVKINEKGTITSILKIKAGNLFEASNKAILNNKNLIVDDLKFKLFLSKINDYLDPKITSSLKIIDFANSNLEVDGGLKINLDKLAINPNINIKMNDPINVVPIKGVRVATTLNGVYENDNLKIKLKNELLSGIIVTDVNTKLNLLSIPSELDKFNPVFVNILATNLKLSKEFIQETLYSEKKNVSKQEPSNLKNSIKSPAVKIVLPEVKVKVEGKNIYIGNEEVSLLAQINTNKNIILGYNLELKYGKGIVKAPFKSILKDSNNIFSDFAMSMSNIELSSFSPLLPPVVSGVSGNFSGTVKGNVALLDQGIRYKINSNVNASNGEIKDFKLKDLIIKMFDSIKDKFPQKIENVTNRFKTLKIVANVDEAVNQLKQFEFIGDKNSFELKLKGNVHMTDKESVLIGSFKDLNTSKTLKDKTGFDAYPVKFSGKGVMLINPHPEYTIQLLAGGLAKKEANKKVKKEVKKLEQKAKKELKKIFKGISF